MKNKTLLTVITCNLFFLAPAAYASAGLTDVSAEARGDKVATFGGGSGTASTKSQQALASQHYQAQNLDAAPVEPDPYQYATANACGYTDNLTEAATECIPISCTSSDGVKGELINTYYAPAGSASNAGTHQKGTTTSIAQDLKGYEAGGTYCSSETANLQDGETNEIITITVTQEDFRNLAVLPSTIMGQGNGHTLKNFNTNLWAEPQEQTFNTDINGRAVQIIATPVSYIFDYGDGTRVTSSNPGYGLSADKEWADIQTPTSHVYTQTGDYLANVTTVYSGRYSVEGGPWLPVAGTNEVTSDNRLVRVWRVEVGNVAEGCAGNPGAWGC